MVTVYVPTPYRDLTAGTARVRAAGCDLGEVLAGLDAAYPGFQARVCQDGDLKHYINVYLNGEEVRSLQGIRTPVQDGDEVAIIPAVAGGAALGAGRRTSPRLPRSGRWSS